MSLNIAAGQIEVQGGLPTIVLVTDWGNEPAGVEQVRRSAVLVEPPAADMPALPTPVWRPDTPGPYRSMSTGG